MPALIMFAAWMGILACFMAFVFHQLHCEERYYYVQERQVEARRERLPHRVSPGDQIVTKNGLHGTVIGVDHHAGLLTLKYRH